MQYPNEALALNSLKEEALVDIPLNASPATTRVLQKENKILFFIYIKD
jgi:hypothetical protein